MNFMVEAFFGGCISKVINDGKDYLWVEIKRVINDKNNFNLSTKIYRIIEKTLNIVTNRNYLNSDILYEAIEKIFNDFKDNGDTLESVKCGLGLLYSDISEQSCENFMDKFYEGICQDEDLYKRISLILQENGIKINQEEFRQLNESVEESFTQLNKKIDKLDKKIDTKSRNDYENLQNRDSVESRTQEYADKWNENMFLNDFDEWDEKAGVNIKLSDVYFEEYLPHFIWGKNEKISINLKDFLSKYIYEKGTNKMLLILGQPGIGKSTLITWITANFIDKVDDILVYKFASDLKDLDWQNRSEEYDIVNELIKKIGVSFEILDGKILILDGFDEISVGRRVEVLNQLYEKLIKIRSSKNFSLIITCRDNYIIKKLYLIESYYITLQPWSQKQIQDFCELYKNKTKSKISNSTRNIILKNKNVLGIPLILYMVLALNISIEEGSIVDVYDKIFSLKDGGIYDRCFQNKRYEIHHRIGVIKNQIHQISREVAIWMFENNSDEASILQEEYQRICLSNMKKNEKMMDDVMIGNFFKLIKHCEGVDTEEISFIHRSIYEYFVVESLYNSIEDAMLELSEESQLVLAKNISYYLKKGEISGNISEYLQYKILKLFNRLEPEKKKRFYYWWEKVVNKMMEMGMFFYTEKNMMEYKNILEKEVNCFLNLITILSFFERKEEYISINSKQLEKYIRCLNFHSHKINLNGLNLKGCNLSGLLLPNASLQNVNLEGADLRGINLEEANLENVNLEGADLENANLKNANLEDVRLENVCLKNADLEGINLEKINLKGADLSRANLKNANLKGTNLRWINLVTDLSNTSLEGIDLEGVDLEDANLRGIYLERVNLENAKLNHINLKEANLYKASLINASLEEANLEEIRLEEADLSEAKLHKANLKKANLKKTDLIGADLSQADLKGANLEGASLYGAIIKGANLDETNLKQANINNSIWVEEDINKFLFQLIDTVFKYIVIETKIGLRKKIYRYDLLHV